MGTLATDGNIKQLLLVVDANGYIFSSLNWHLNGLMMDRWTQQFCILAKVIKGICQMIPFCEGFWLSVHLKGDKFDILVCRSVKSSGENYSKCLRVIKPAWWWPGPVRLDGVDDSGDDHREQDVAGNDKIIYNLF